MSTLGAVTRSEELRQSIARWAGAIQDWNIEWETGIYPGEMASFLGLCSLLGVASIIESGRGDGYSTQVLGAYADRTGVSVVSIDLESDRAQAAKCRQKVERYRRLRCLVGDAYNVFPAAAKGLPGPIALLLDGPKLQAANRFSLVASLMFPITVVAHHNCELVTPWGREFSSVFPGAFHHDELDMAQVTEWQRFKVWERESVRGYELPGIPGRSLSSSSLALTIPGAEHRSYRQLLRLGGRPIRSSPPWLWAKWSLLAAVASK